jgi:branched-chain amino acid transport system permease protein
MEFIQQLINGLMQGSLYALIAIGFTLIFGVVGMLNLAHAQAFMLAGYATYFMVMHTPLPLYLVFPFALVVSSIVGILVELICFRPISKQFHFAPLIATIALGIVISETVINFAGSDPKFISGDLTMSTYSFGGMIVSSSQILLLVITLTAMIVLSILIEKTKIGRAMRTLAESEKAAKLLGVPINKVVVLTFIISSVLAGIAGFLYTLRFETTSPLMGDIIGLKGMAVMMVGGLGSVYGAMVAGILMGLLEVLAISLPFGTAPFADAIVWGTMILVLLFRPSGIMGSSTVQTERV